MFVMTVFIPADAKKYRTLIEGISKVTSEGRIILQKPPTKSPKVVFKSANMDGSHIILVYLELWQEFFSKFECDEKEVQIGLNFDDLTKIQKIAKSDDEMSFEYVAAEKKIVMSLKKEGASKSRKNSLKCIDIDVEELDMESVLKTEYKNIIMIPTAKLEDAIKNAEIFSEVIEFATKNSSIVFQAEGNIGDMDYELDDADYLNNIKTIDPTDSSCAFAIQMLKSVINTDYSANCKISFSPENPIRLDYEFDHGKMIFYVAPRVEEDADNQDE